MARSFESVRLLICDPNPAIRSGLKGALFSFGFRSISDTGSFTRIHDMIEQDAVDLVIMASSLEGNDTGFLVQEMRHQRLGTNPFIVIITLLNDADPANVRKVIDAGTDDLLLMPVSPEQLFNRIDKLTNTRKPFVVTHDYIGPDRRTKTRQFQQSAPTLQAPNVLKARIQDGLDGTRVNLQIRESAAHLNRMKIERNLTQIDWLVNHIGAAIREGSGEESLMDYATQLAKTAEDIAHRIKGTPAEPHMATAMELLELARQLESDPTGIGFSDLENLAHLPKVLAKAIGRKTEQPSNAAQ